MTLLTYPRKLDLTVQEDFSAFLLKQTLSCCCQILFGALQTPRDIFIYEYTKENSVKVTFFLTT